VEVPGHEPVADALDAVMAPLAPREQGALRGLDRVEPHPWVLPTEIAAHPGDEATRALRVHEGADLAGGAAHLLPELGPGGQRVGLDVVGVVELARYPVAPRLAPAHLGAGRERGVPVPLAPRA